MLIIGLLNKTPLPRTLALKNAPQRFILPFLFLPLVSWTQPGLSQTVGITKTEIELSPSAAFKGTSVTLASELWRGAHKPDLIFMDINLPEMDGITAMKKLKTYEETRDIPVIALSANAMRRDIDHALQEGFDSYITKPIDVPQFLEKIERILYHNATFQDTVNVAKEGSK